MFAVEENEPSININDFIALIYFDVFFTKCQSVLFSIFVAFFVIFLNECRLVKPMSYIAV